MRYIRRILTLRSRTVTPTPQPVALAELSMIMHSTMAGGTFGVRSPR